MLSNSLLSAALLLTIAASAVRAAPSGDACADISSALSQNVNATISVGQVRSCFDSFPFSSEIRDKTLRVVSNVLDIYAFDDIVNNSPHPDFVKNYDIRGKLAELKQKTFKSDREFHQAVVDAFPRLYDGHTEASFECYERFAYLQPWFLGGVANEQDYATVFIHSLDKDHPSVKALGLDKYLGAEVVEIDGQPTAQTLQKYMDEHWGVSKDPNTRFNRALASKLWDDSKKSFRVSRGSFMSRYNVPESEGLTYKLIPAGKTEPETVTIPWWVRNTGMLTWKDKDTYWKSACLASAGNLDSSRLPSPAQRKIQPPVKMPRETVPLRQLLTTGTQPGSNLRAPPSPIADPTPLTTGPGFAFFMAPSEPSREGDVPTGVYVMSGFNSPNDAWKQAMIKGVDALKAKGAKKLILDLTNNGGGTICTAYALLKLLIPDRVSPFMTDIRLSPGLGRVIRQTIEKKADTLFAPENWIKDDGSVYDASWIQPPREKKFSGKSSAVQFTQLFRDSCSFDWGDYKSPFASEDLAFLTNGFCASSCSLVANQLYEYAPEVETVVTSALPMNQPVTVSTLPGGQVYRTSYMAGDVDAAGLSSDPELDYNLPLKGEVSFTIREAYSKRTDPDEVLEFLRRNANHRIDMNDKLTLKVDALWTEVKHIKGWAGFSNDPERSEKKKVKA